MEHQEPIFIMRPGLRSLLIASAGILLGPLFIAMGLFTDVPEDGKYGVIAGAAFFGLGAYLLFGYFKVRLIVSKSGMQVSPSYQSRRAKELAWSDVTSISVHPSKYFVTFIGKGGTSIKVGPGSIHWKEFVGLAISELPREVSAPLRSF